jgi:hypothetical protein
MEIIITPCPHCFNEVLIYKNEINCAIFRHGIYKHNGEQISPHAPKEECERLFQEEKIFGCGKPFKLVKIIDNDIERYIAEICDYI